MSGWLTPDWGRWALSLALILSLVQAGAGWFGPAGAARRAAYATAGLVAFAMIVLITAFLASDFSVSSVVANSHTQKPLIYKIAAAWGHHEGSMVLWCLVLSGFAAMFAARPGVEPALASRALAVLGALAAAFLAFTLFASNPFGRIPAAPWEGTGFNPLLQDPAVAIHPPMLYTGYVGLAVPFALAVAALSVGAGFGGDDGAAQRARWARAMRRWALAAFAALTVGIALGSFWAYYELGWGGWWFWDPVENASLMPWLLAASLFHAALTTERRGLLSGWTALLAIGAFSLSIFGTFLTRSGVLTSVHAFALDPSRGLLLLIILAAAAGPALALFALRSGTFGPPSPPARLMSREGLLVLNNLFIVATAGVVLLGTVWPLIVDAAGGPPVTVGPPYFTTAALPIIAVAFLLSPVAGLAAWGGGLARRDRVVAGVLVAAVAGLGLIAATALGAGGGPALAGALGLWLILGGGLHAAHALGALGDDRGVEWRAAVDRARLRPSLLAGPLAHAGMGLLAIGAAAGAAYPLERQALMTVGDVFSWNGSTATLERMARADGPNYVADQAVITVTRPNGETHTFTPERRAYTATGDVTSEVAIRASLGGDLYLALGPAQPTAEGGVAWTVRIMENRLIWMVFWGAGLTAFGAALAFAGAARLGRRVPTRPVAADTPAPAAPLAVGPAERVAEPSA